MKAIFLDRDGVINIDPGFGDYIKSWEEFKFYPGSLEAIKKLTDSGYDIFVISNQAGVAKGIYSQEALDEITRNMLKEIKANGGKIKSISYCTHASDAGCPCRKPNTGMIEKAVTGLDIDFKQAYFIGDSRLDIGAGKNMGCKTILLTTGKEDIADTNNWQANPDFIKKDLKEAVEWVLKAGQK